MQVINFILVYNNAWFVLNQAKRNVLYGKDYYR